MNENWTPKNPPELSDNDAELLSAYIDNMLDAQERAALEARLATDAFLRSELAAMRQMIGWIKTMPRLKAPRNFTISEADVKPAAPKIVPLPSRRYNWQVASAAAVFVLVLGGVLLYNQFNLKVAEVPANNIAANFTATSVPRETDSGTATPIFLPTVGVPPNVQDNANAGGVPEEAEAASNEPDDAARSSESSIAMDTQIESTDTGAELAPQGSGGSGSGGGGDGNDESSTAVVGGAADGQITDIQMRTTATSETAPLAIASATAQALASPTPQPALNTQAETRNFEPTMVAATAAPQATQAAYTGEAFYATPTVEAAAEESMTMMIAESTEATLEIEAAAPLGATGDDTDSATAQEMAITVVSLDVPGRIYAARQRVLQQIIGRE